MSIVDSGAATTTGFPPWPRRGPADSADLVDHVAVSRRSGRAHDHRVGKAPRHDRRAGRVHDHGVLDAHRASSHASGAIPGATGASRQIHVAKRLTFVQRPPTPEPYPTRHTRARQHCQCVWTLIRGPIRSTSHSAPRLPSALLRRTSSSRMNTASATTRPHLRPACQDAIDTPRQIHRRLAGPRAEEPLQPGHHRVTAANATPRAPATRARERPGPRAVFDGVDQLGHGADADRASSPGSRVWSMPRSAPSTQSMVRIPHV